ncbi:uncharacterized protein LOC133862708 [Alnus glutinosa]|uniref:uncharacterized protein LOC133862708 n=1 Tax=Alnus glutinosa TaxID=3517 RepID=UPI002D7752EB|nr:uncharacterized protein LOC133862708 [Alnus glutinosa]
MYVASSMRKSFKDYLKVLEADIQHANTLCQGGKPTKHQPKQDKRAPNHESGTADREREIERSREREKFLVGRPLLGGRQHQRSWLAPAMPKIGFPVAKQWESGFFSS